MKGGLRVGLEFGAGVCFGLAGCGFKVGLRWVQGCLMVGLPGVSWGGSGVKVGLLACLHTSHNQNPVLK